MILHGKNAIDYLTDKVNSDDPSASSHWKKYHSTFRFNGDRFQGLQGFGGCTRPYSGLRYLGHSFLQRHYRLMGAEFSEFDQIDKLGQAITNRQKRAYDLDVLRQVLTISFLKSLCQKSLTVKNMSCVIGDGFASLTTLLLASQSAGGVVLINLTKTLLVDLYYTKLYMGTSAFETLVSLVTNVEDIQRLLESWTDIEMGGRVVAIEASKSDLMRECPIDFVFNIVSMQEMDPPIISAYFENMRTIAAKREVVFYCCNREDKTLPDGTITHFNSYPWQDNDEIHIDGLCPWHQRYYTFIPPFYRPYDGPIRHRLVTLGS